MKPILTILFGLAIVVLPIVSACKKDPVSCNWLTELQNESEALNAAATEYANDPTNTAKCEAYRDAFQDYLNEAENHVGCATTAGQGAELQASIDSAQASLDALQC